MVKSAQPVLVIENFSYVPSGVRNDIIFRINDGKLLENSFSIYTSNDTQEHVDCFGAISRTKGQHIQTTFIFCLLANLNTFFRRKTWMLKPFFDLVGCILAKEPAKLTQQILVNLSLSHLFWLKNWVFNHIVHCVNILFEVGHHNHELDFGVSL